MPAQTHTREERTPAAPPVRRVTFGHNQKLAEMPKYFMSGDPFMSHFMAVFSSLFPEGEQFFIRSVRAHRDQITDPVLRRQLAGFIGQEAVHSREHEEFNETLRGYGYRTDLVEWLMRISMRSAERLFSPVTCLSITAALEHSTTTSAVVVLEDLAAQAMFGTDEVRALFTWHALEEVEHKAVAFDVLAATSDSENKRRVVGTVTTLWLVGAALSCTMISLATDKQSCRHPAVTLRSVATLRKSPWLKTRVIRKLAAYQRKGFHPDDENTDELIAHWRETFPTDLRHIQAR